MFPFYSQSQRLKMSVLTNPCLDFPGAQERKASETYAEWRERPAKRSAVRFERSLGFRQRTNQSHDSQYGSA
jgi:hypothetical protein